MGEFLGALVAITLIDRFRIVGPNENMACLISAADESSNSFLRPVFFLRQIDWAVTQAKKTSCSPKRCSVLPKDRLVIGSRIHI